MTTRDDRPLEERLRAEWDVALVHAALTADRTRHALARTLHGGPIQDGLAALQDLAELAPEPATIRARAAIDSCARALRTTAAELHQPGAASHGLAAALETVAAYHAGRSGFELELALDLQPRERLGPAIFEIARELITNAAKHARPTRVRVTVVRAGNTVQLNVADNGIGFERPARRAAEAAGHLGLRAIEEQVTLLGGTVVVASRPGEGTRIEVGIPDA